MTSMTEELNYFFFKDFLTHLRVRESQLEHKWEGRGDAEGDGEADPQ